MAMSSLEVHLKAYDVFEAVLVAGTVEAAIAPVRTELEVLPREELIRVAMALAVEGVLKLPSPPDRVRLLKRVQFARLQTMWAGS